MKRDFSTEVEEEILSFTDRIEQEGNDYCIEFSNEEIAEYEYFGIDIEYHMNHLRLHHQYLVERCGYTREVIEKIFEDVRTFDREYAEHTICEDINTTMKPYMKTMKALLDSIRVSPEGTDFSAVDYAASARTEYESCGSISGKYASIFADPAVFRQKLAAAGSGLLGNTYEELQTEEGFAALMEKSREEIKPWEVLALSQMFDDCITEDAGGSYQVDYDALSALLERCYVQSRYREPVSQHDVMMSGSATYELAPVMEVLLMYRDVQTDRTVGIYMNPDARRLTQLSQEQMMAECYITDTIYGVCGYYSEITLDSWSDRDYDRLHIAIDDSQEGRLVLSIDNESEAEQKTVTIYGFAENLSGESNQADTESVLSELLDTKQEVTTTMADIGIRRGTKAIAGVVPGGGTVMELYGGARDIYRVWNAYQSSEDYNAECYDKVRGLELQGVVYTLDCNGTVVQCGDDVAVRHLAMDQTEITVDVALYNEYHPEAPITVEQLEEELEGFVSGKASKEDCTGIQALQSFDRAEQYDAQEHPLSRYTTYVQEYLKKQYDLRFVDQATLEQLEEAAEYAAKQWREDPGEY